MQEQRGVEKSSAEPIDLNQGSVSSSNSPNQPTAWNSYTLENQNVRPFGGWHMGESSTSTNSNLQQWQSQWLASTSRSESSFDTPTSTGSSNVPVNENLSRPYNINLNAEHMASGSDGGPENVDAFPCNVDNNNIDNNGDWGSSGKRKALDGGSSSSFQQGEVFDRHHFHSGCNSNVSSPPSHSPNFRQSEEPNLQVGTGRGLESDIFPPMGIPETGESSSRNNEARVDHDYDRFNTPSRNEMSLSEFLYRHRTGRPIFAMDTFENQQVPSSVRDRPQMMHNPELSRNPSSSSFHRAGTSRASSIAESISAERRRNSSQNEGNLASLTRNSNENSSYVGLSEIRYNLNTSPENREENLESLVRNSNENGLPEIRYNLSSSPPPWFTPLQNYSMNISPENARVSSPPPPWFPPPLNYLTYNPQRSSQFYPWNPFPSVDSVSSHSDASSPEEAIMSQRPDQGHASPPLSGIQENLELEQEEDTLDSEERQRMVSENHRRFPGIPGFRDRHGDMRLDVDSMSYEELLALEEHIGDVNAGLSEKDILSFMKQRKHLCLFDRSSPNLELCSICQEDYVYGDDVGELDCGHDFHTDCIKQWLTQKNLCPICKLMALDT